MKALVTGATGFIGGALARRLLREGWKVRCLVRDPARADPLRRAGAELVRGDVTDPATLPPALKGIEIVFHAAANVDIVFPKRDEIMRTNVEGTRNVLEAALQAKVRRVVHVSSVAALGRRFEGADETVFHDGNYVSVYEESKHKAEQVAFAYGHKGLDVVHVLPCVVLGPGDPKSGDVIRRFLQRRIPAVPRKEGSSSFVHIDDLVEGILLAAKKGQKNERYIFSQVTWKTGETMAELSRLTGIPPPRRIPTWVAMTAAWVEERRARLGKRPARFSRQAVRLATKRYGYSSDRARQELGWRPADFRERFAEVVRYWQKEVGTNGAA